MGSLIQLILVLFSIIAARTLLRSRRISRLLPPGPAGHWLFGNHIPSHSWRAFYEWSKQYGDVMTIRTGRKLLIVVGSYESASEILEKHGAATADRPGSISVGEILSGGMRVLILREGDKLKRMRRALHANLQPKAAVEYESLQTRAARNVILDILREPSNFQDHASRYAASVIISITYGKQTASSVKDPNIRAVQECLRRLTDSLRPGLYLVDSYPFLRYIPGYLKQLRQWHREELHLFRSQYDTVKSQLSSEPMVPSSFAKYLIQRQQEFSLTDDEAAYVCGSLFGAGSDTTAGAIMVLVMAAACFPEAQRKAQEQLDNIVGRSRMPSFADWADLPYIHAFVLESYRWRPISSGGFAHRATEDILYKGYLIPKGASVVGNHWGISRDPSLFPSPETFDPSRWLDDQGHLREDLRSVNFGFGRRVCPGMHVANRSLFINAAFILWSFNIFQDPQEPIDTLAFTNLANSHPLPFKACFQPRFSGVEIIINSTDTDPY